MVEDVRLQTLNALSESGKDQVDAWRHGRLPYYSAYLPVEAWNFRCLTYLLSYEVEEKSQSVSSSGKIIKYPLRKDVLPLS